MGYSIYTDLGNIGVTATSTLVVGLTIGKYTTTYSAVMVQLYPYS